MNKKQTCVAVLAMLLSGFAAEAQVNTTYSSDDRIDRDRDRVPGDDLLFQAHELNFDLFGTVSLGQETIEHLSDNRVQDDGRLGLGLGLTYFPTRMLGIGGDAYTENTQHSFVDNASGNLILRFPIESAHLAPYIYGGGGRQFDPSEEWFAQAGAGLELRIIRNFGIFADARYVFLDRFDDFGVGRLGLRLRY
jgi:hypothetical protein